MTSLAVLIEVVVITYTILLAIEAGKTGVYKPDVGAKLQAAIVSIDESTLSEPINELSDIAAAYSCCCSTGILFTPEKIDNITLTLKTIISDLKLIFKVQAAANNIDFTTEQINFLFYTVGGGCTTTC
jgi:hypothetical protein